MGVSVPYRTTHSIDLSWNEATGAVGDSVTVFPIVVAVAMLSELSLAVMLIWFGTFQIVWGLYYGVPLSVEPMKALAALIIGGTVTTGEFLVAGLFLGVILLAIGQTHTLDRVEQYIGSPVVRGIQLAVALVLLETGLQLGGTDPQLASIAVAIAVGVIALGYWNLSALVVLLVGGTIAVSSTGVPSPALPSTGGALVVSWTGLTLPAVEATVAQLAMTLGNAALATTVLMSDYFNREISPDELVSSMGVMNLAAIPFGAVPMCHGSGGVAGKYAFGARTAGANLILGVGYVAVAVLAAPVVAAYPLSMLGVILGLIALQLGRTSLQETDKYLTVLGIGAAGVVVNLGVAFVAGMSLYLLLTRYGYL